MPSNTQRSPSARARWAGVVATVAISLFPLRLWAADGGTAAAPATTGGVAAPAAAAASPATADTAATPRPEDTCHAGISAATAQHIFDAIGKAAPAKSQCTFEGVSTERQTLSVKWSLSGKPQTPMTVQIRDCMKAPPAGSGAFVIEVPAELLQQCPDWKGFEAEFRTTVSSEAPLTFSTGGASPPKWRRYAVIALLVLAGAGVIALRRRPPEPSPPPPGSGGAA